MIAKPIIQSLKSDQPHAMTTLSDIEQRCKTFVCQQLTDTAEGCGWSHSSTVLLAPSRRHLRVYLLSAACGRCRSVFCVDLLFGWFCVYLYLVLLFHKFYIYTFALVLSACNRSSRNIPLRMVMNMMSARVAAVNGEQSFSPW